MGQRDYYAPGQWNAYCDLCGRKYKSGELSRNWKGQMVCSYDYESRHPQDFVRGVPDGKPPPWVRPEGDAPALGVCSPNDQTAIIGFAVVGCVKVGYTHPAADFTHYPTGYAE